MRHEMYCSDRTVAVMLMLLFESPAITGCNALSVYGAMMDR